MRILEIRKDGKLLRWINLAELIELDPSWEVRLATCDDPKRVYEKLERKEDDILAAAGL